MIVSIPHTGSELLSHILKRPFCHIGEEAEPHQNMVIPLRHPYVVAESWKRRGPYDLDDLYRRWELLINDFDPFDPFYVAIDTPLRDSQLKAIKDIETDWPIVNSEAFTWKLDYRHIEPDLLIESLVNKNKAFFSRFYHV